MGKKSKKEKHSKSDKSSKTKTEQISLGLALNAAFLQYPGLFEELPAMLRAFDEGEFVAIHKIADVGKRQHLESVMDALPLEFHAEYGWSKSRIINNTPISEIVLRILLEYGFVGEPLELSIAEQKASRTPPMILLHLLQKFPALLDELTSLLEQVLDGNAVQLGDLPDEELAEELERLLKSLGLVVSHEGIGLPDNRDERASVQRILASFQTIFEDYQQQQKLARKRDKQISKETKKSKKNKDNKKKHRHQQPSSPDASSESEGSSQRDTEAVISTVPAAEIQLLQPPTLSAIGPQRPTIQDLQYAVQSTYSHHDEEDDDDDEEDEGGFGPRAYQPPPVQYLPSSSSSAMMVQALPLGYVGTALPSAGYQSSGDEDANGDQEAAAISTQREEWILNPGDSRALRALGGGGADMIAEFGKNRKFASGKTAKKTEEALVIQREFARAQQEKQRQSEQDAAGTGDGENDEHDDSGGESRKRAHNPLSSSRGPSLMEEHLAKKARSNEDSSNERRRFDREKDVLQHRKLNDKEVSQLVTNARELGGRFNQPVVQKSFL